jgi:hypothetical protein|tara:strand:+ start:203 stop:451 length:249 start_codon:yes stop_codon:yes gene_type:complete
MTHPAETRYPFLKNKTEPQYTEWKKIFAWFPLVTIGNRKIWFKTVFARKIIIEWTPPTYPAGPYEKIQYATWEEILNIKMKS